jgi:carboxylesterase
MPGRSLAQNLRLIRRVKKDLGKVSAPLLIVHALEDDITHVRNARRLAASVSGEVETLFLTDSYHLVTVDRERAKVARATQAFLDRLSAPPSPMITPAPRPVEPAETLIPA